MNCCSVHKHTQQSEPSTQQLVIEAILLCTGENSNTAVWGLVSITKSTQRLSFWASPRSVVPELMLCVEVGPTISSWYRSTSHTSSSSCQRDDNKHAKNHSAMPGLSTPRSPSLPSTQLTVHLTPMPVAEGCGPTGRWLHLVLLGCAWPSPMGQGPATRCSPASFPSWAGSRRGPWFPFPGQGAAAPSWLIHIGSVNRSMYGPSPGTNLHWETLSGAIDLNNTAPMITGTHKPFTAFRWRLFSCADRVCVLPRTRMPG